MVLALVLIGSGVGALIALAALLTLGLGPVAALLVFWIGGLAATLALAVGVTRNPGLGAMQDDVTGATPPLGEGR